MSNPYLVTACLALSACAIPGLSGVAGISTPSASSGHGFTPAPAPSHPAPAPHPSPAQTGPSDDEIRAANEKAEHERLDREMTEYDHQANPLWDVAAAVQTAKDRLAAFLTPQVPYGEDSKTLSREGQSCAAFVAGQLAAGKHGTDTILVADQHGDAFVKRPVTLADADRTICQPLIAHGKSYDADVAAQTTRENAVFEAPYRKAGVAGEKLAIVLRLSPKWTRGQEIADTPTEIARASVFFDVAHPDAFHWTLYRYQFSGNDLVSTTHRGFIAEPGPEAYR